MDKGREFSAGLLIYLVYIPLVLLAPVQWAPYVAFAILALLLVLPLFLLKAVAQGRFDVDQSDEARVVYRGWKRRGTVQFQLTALASLIVVLSSILGGAVYEPQWFGLFPWGVRIGLVALGLFVLSPKVPVSHEVLVLDGDRLRFQSRKTLSDGYEKPGEIAVSDVAAIRYSHQPIYDTGSEPQLYLAFTTRGGGAFRVLVSGVLRPQVERFLNYLHGRYDAIEMDSAQE